jgi:VWFA-related protein
MLPRFSFLSRLSAALLAAIFAVSIAAAQQPPGPTDDEPDVQEQPSQQQPSAGTLKVNVDVVNIFCNVKDKHGALVPNLTKNDFEISEDGKPQSLKYFASEANQPLTLGLLIDTSGSQQRVLPMEQDAASQFLDEVIRPNDLAFVIDFDVDVNLEQDFTNNKHQLRQAIEQAKINTGGGGGGLPGLGQGPFPTSGTPRGTLLYDAVYLAANEKLAHEVGRKAMILLTDGEDQGSKLRIQDAIEAAQKADAICYVILIADRGFYGGMGYSGDSQMHKLSEETGGRVIDVGNKPEKLRQAFDQIAAELRTQYLLGYTPTNQKRDGTFRKISIKTTKEDLKLQARKGYYAPGS